ncbi:hypothetical protein F5Y10DRAFT_294447 [Nemania abortiva]|nr:hypothetical protein F5Y10DRAFT_294447 [Nemania abortiva]
MTTIPETASKRAIHKFRQCLTDEQNKDFAATSQDDVYDEIQKIQHRYGSTRKLRSLGRLSKFLEAMSQIEQLVQIFLNVSEVVAFVWGPIKLALLVAGAHLETLECLLDTYVEIGEVVPGLRQYDQLFKTAPFVLEILEKYFYDILEFHRSALSVFLRPSWKKFFGYTWKTFRVTFKPILESLKRHRALLLDERLNAAVLETQSSRERILMALDKSTNQTKNQFNGLERHVQEVFTKLSDQIYGLQQSTNSNGERISSIVDKLDPPDYKDDQSSALASRHSGSGEWIFNTDIFKKWAHSNRMPESVLFIHGMPGAGKTIIASSIISKLKPEEEFCHRTCLFFYFKHSNDAKRSMANMLRALLVQLMHQDSTLVPIFYEKCSVVSNAEARQLHSLKTWAVELLKSQNICTIILDGLDECHRHHTGKSEARKILEWLLLSVIPDCERQGTIIRLLILGQRDGDVDDALSSYPSIRLDREISHSNDVSTFIQKQASEIGKRFALDPKEESDIAQKITEKARGMFLYAKIVVDNLVAQGSIAELDEEIQTKFPAGLDQAYERVAFRVLDCCTRPVKQREAAARILRWLVCATRPLRWSEIQCLFCIDPDLGLCNTNKRRVDNYKGLCGSFVEDDINPNPTQLLQLSPVVSLVHETARRYLIQTCRVDLLEENARMAIWSSAYLASSPFGKELDDRSIRQNALSGYYGLEDYAVSSVQSHVDLSLKRLNDLHSATTQRLRHMLYMLIKRLDINMSLEIEVGDLESMRASLDYDEYETLSRRLEQMSTVIRRVTEDINPTVLDAKTRDVFYSLNGYPQYKCSKVKCLMFSHGFKDKKSRDFHTAQHYNQITCSTDGCPRQTIGFLSRLDLEKHRTEFHKSPAKKLDSFPSLKKPKDIWSACAQGDIEFVKNFNARGGNLRDAREPDGRITPILIAARNGHLDICQYLSLNGCNIFGPGTSALIKYSALGEAIRARNVELFDTLLNSFSEAEIGKIIGDGDLSRHIAEAVHSGDSYFLKPLLSMRSKHDLNHTNKFIFEDLIDAKRTYTPSVVSLMEELFASMKAEDAAQILARGNRRGGNFVLHRACTYGNPNAVAFLLRHMEAQDVYALNNEGKSALHEAINGGCVEIIKLFIEHDLVNGMAVCDSNQNWPLHVACKSWKPDIVKLLIPYSINHLKEGDARGNTPLHLAIMFGGYEKLSIIVQLLGTEAVDLSKRNQAGQTVLDLDTTLEIHELLHSAKPQADMASTLAVGNKATMAVDENSAESALHGKDGISTRDTQSILCE